MKKITPNKLSLVILLVNAILMIITIMQSSRDKVMNYAGSGIARTVFFISIVLSVIALVYTIIARKKGQAASLPLGRVNIVISLLVLLIPSIALGSVFSDASSLFGLIVDNCFV